MEAFENDQKATRALSQSSAKGTSKPLARLLEKIPWFRGMDQQDHPASELRKLAKSSGIYALASITTPFISLVLTPFLARNLAAADFGILAVINTAIGFSAGITQLGLASAFFRAYGYDYTLAQDKRDVIATTTTMLCITTTVVALLVALFARQLADFLFGQPELANYIALAGIVVLLQNLTIPAMAWLRAEGRPLPYSLLSISNMLITLLGTVILLGSLNWGVAGAIIANGAGFAFIVMLTLPVLIFRAGLKIRFDIARSMLAFGLPLVLNFVSFWVLQLSDRYLLSLLGSLVETAHYAVAYTFGGAMSVVVMGPFALAWPAAMFAIAKRDDAKKIFQTLFRWFSLTLLLVAFSFSLVGTVLLDWLFPAGYRSSAFVIPLVAESISFYGVYYIFITGVNIIRKTWMISIFSTIAAITNVLLNLFLIPRYGSAGAAASTLLAYIVLAAIAYVVDQRVYPIPFEIGIFLLAQVLGIALYTESNLLLPVENSLASLALRLGALALYACCLGLLGMAPAWWRRWRLRDERTKARAIAAEGLERNGHDA